GHHAGRRRLDRGAGGCGDVHARVRRPRLAVVDALVAETAADPALHRPDEAAGEIGAVVVAAARGGDLGLLAGDAFCDGRRRIHGLRRHAIDALHWPVARADRDPLDAADAIRADHGDLDRCGLVAADAEHHGAVAGGAQHATGVFHT